MRLQFHSRSEYFSALARRSLGWVVTAVLVGCGERDRLTFPVEAPPGNRVGPFTTITQPLAGDTLIFPGDPFVLSGFARDPDGVDAIYFEVTGAGFSYSPVDGNGADSVQFAIQIPTLGISGGTVLVSIFAVDKLGETGITAVRQIRIR